MGAIRRLSQATVALAMVVSLAFPALWLGAQQTADPAPHVGRNDLGGSVSSVSGQEAGVWVIAETDDLPTKFAKIVVTDEQGRYLMPDLPDANYRVWVRGYGLIDSPTVQTKPGQTLDLKAVLAPHAAAAAEYFPAIYWYALLKIPGKNEFPGTGAQGNGMPEHLKSQAQWLNVVKTNGCMSCHQLGNKAMRTMPTMFAELNTSVEAWQRRIQSGQAMTQMVNAIGRVDATRAYTLFADWTDRIAAGALPVSQPARPQGVERHVVMTLWDWSSPKAYLHDEISTDKRNPTVNANGKLYGAPEESTDYLMDGRIDDPQAGWKGKGLWATYSTRAPFHLEGGKGTRPKVVKFQLRPDPLAR
jgi:hypothetical protein